MAKKKLTHQSKQEEEDEHPPQPQNDADKLQNLKNLNSLLLKETSERRQQVQSLIDANHTLESSLNRSAMQNQLLQSHLSDAADDNVVSELQNAVAFVFVKSQVTELGFLFASLVAEKNDMESVVSDLKVEVCEVKSILEDERVRFGRVSEEKDEMKREFEGFIADANVLKEKLLEGEKRERKLLEEVEKLREEGFQKERGIREVMGERDFAVRNMRESAMVIEELKEEKNEILKEKSEILKVNDAQKVTIESMEFEMTRVNEDLCDLQKREGFMRGKILELEERVGLAVEKEEGLMLEIRDLRKQKEELEVSVEMLKRKRDSVLEVLDLVQKQLEDKRREIDETIRAKNEIEEAKVSREAEIVELRREIVRLVSELNESCRGLEVINRDLLLEVDSYRNTVDGVVVERDNIRKGFDEEKNKVKSLMLQVAEMEGKIEEMAGEIGLMRGEREKLLGKNEMMESRVEVLMNEKDALQQSLLEAQRERDDMRAKVQFSSINSNRVLEMLKSTAAELVCRFKEGALEVGSNEQKPEEEIQPYAEQLHAIKDAFRSKDKMVADMKQQSEVLQNSVARAHKMKSFWTVISSATSILAAALAAYVAKGR